MRPPIRISLFALALAAQAAACAAEMQFDCPPMQYPNEARRKEWQGMAVATFVAQADGTVNNVRIVKSSGHAVLDLATQESVAGCKVKPQLKEAVVPGREYKLAFQWKLDGRPPPGPPPSKALQERAERGDAAAQYEYGVALMKAAATGPAVEAQAWLEKAARNGHAPAQVLLGDMTRVGGNRERDPALAADWYRKAAEQGNAAAQARLSTMLFTGEGVSADPAQALAWARKAAEQGLAAAQSALAAQLIVSAGDTPEALAWMRKAAAQDDAFGQYLLGRCLQVGRGVPADAAAAARLYEQSAAKGYKPAQRELANLLEQGQGIPVDKEKARLLREAANN